MKIEQMIDHTLLKPDVTASQIERLCEEAKTYGFASVCVNSSFVSMCAEVLSGSNVAVCTVIGFPLGAMSTFGKRMETRGALQDGAKEVDMVVHIGKVKSHDWDYVEEDIRSVVEETKGQALVKVILETGYLTDEEKRQVCRIAKKAGADFVKTSTGFGPAGAVKEDILLMRETVGKTMGVKASGGVKTREKALEMIEAGANRIGTSSGIAIVRGEGR